MHNQSQQPIEHLENQDFEALLTAVSKVALVSVTNAKGDIIYVNDKFVEVSKYSRAELIGQNHRILKSGHQPQVLFDDLWKTISEGRLWRGEIKNKAKDGSYYWVDTSICPILGEHGTPERYLAVRFLITEKKEAETDLIKQNKAVLNVMEDLQEEKKKYQTQVLETQKFALAIQSSGEHIVITDPEGIILFANHSAEVMTGYTIAEMLGTKAGVLWGRQMESHFYRQLWNVIKVQKKVFKGEFNNVRKNGSQYVASATISPVLGENNEVLFFIGTEVDVTKAREIDRAKTEFVSLASHQLRTPLSAINWYAEMLIEGDAGKLNPEQEKYVKEVYAGNKRMVDLVNALLNVSRLDLGTFMVEPEPVHLSEVAQSILVELESQRQVKQVNFTVDIMKELPAVSVDPKLIRMVFQNLLSNAVKYSNAGGEVLLAVRTVKKGEQVDTLAAREDSMLIMVKDGGIGIPKSQQEKIFSKLFRADNAMETETEGTGLGLYIVKSILEQSGGTVWFESEEQKGTTFYVLFPLTGMKAKRGTKQLD